MSVRIRWPSFGNCCIAADQAESVCKPRCLEYGKKIRLVGPSHSVWLHHHRQLRTAFKMRQRRKNPKGADAQVVQCILVPVRRRRVEGAGVHCLRCGWRYWYSMQGHWVLHWCSVKYGLEQCFIIHRIAVRCRYCIRYHSPGSLSAIAIVKGRKGLRGEETHAYGTLGCIPWLSCWTSVWLKRLRQA